MNKRRLIKKKNIGDSLLSCGYFTVNVQTQVIEQYCIYDECLVVVTSLTVLRKPQGMSRRLLMRR